jgi:YhcH/YjgK/YiaL family protein
MILDTIANADTYKNISPHIARTFKFLRAFDITGKGDGRYDIDGNNIFCIVQRYKTKPPTDKLEVHRKYIDIQFLAKGAEQIGYAPAGRLKQAAAYNEEKDVGFFYADGDTTFLNMTEGDFVIFWPSDAHMPGCQVNESQEVIKVVFKIRI